MHCQPSLTKLKDQRGWLWVTSSLLVTPSLAPMTLSSQEGSYRHRGKAGAHIGRECNALLPLADYTTPATFQDTSNALMIFLSSRLTTFGMILPLTTDLGDLVFDPTCVRKGTRVWVCGSSPALPTRGEGEALSPRVRGDDRGLPSSPSKTSTPATTCWRMTACPIASCARYGECIAA